MMKVMGRVLALNSQLTEGCLFILSVPFGHVFVVATPFLSAHKVVIRIRLIVAFDHFYVQLIFRFGSQEQALFLPD